MTARRARGPTLDGENPAVAEGRPGVVVGVGRGDIATLEFAAEHTDAGRPIGFRVESPWTIRRGPDPVEIIGGRNQIRSRSLGCGHIADATTSEKQLKTGGFGTRRHQSDSQGRATQDDCQGTSCWLRLDTLHRRKAVRQGPRRAAVEAKSCPNGSILIGFPVGVGKSRHGGAYYGGGVRDVLLQRFLDNLDAVNDQ